MDQHSFSDTPRAHQNNGSSYRRFEQRKEEIKIRTTLHLSLGLADSMVGIAVPPRVLGANPSNDVSR
jgi:hypothetical protein